MVLDTAVKLSELFEVPFITLEAHLVLWPSQKVTRSCCPNRN